MKIRSLKAAIEAGYVPGAVIENNNGDKVHIEKVYIGTTKTIWVIDTSLYHGRIENTRLLPRKKLPLAFIGRWGVAYQKNGIKVGCTHISIEEIQAIASYYSKPKKKVKKVKK